MRSGERILQRIFRGLAEYGLRGSEQPDERREHTVINLFALILTSLGSIMFAVNYVYEEYLTSSIIAFMIILGLVSFMIHLGVHSRRFTRSFIPVIFITIAMILFHHQGFNTPAVNWMYLFPVVLVGGAGLRRGGIAILALGAVFLFFSYQSSLSQSEHFIDSVRFIMTFTGLTLLVMVLEYAREQVEKDWGQVTKRFPIDNKADLLTGLPERKEITALLKNAMEVAEAESTSLSILFCDFDYFKGVASRAPQSTIDGALVQTSRLLKSMITGNDTLARWVNDTFLFILPSTSEKGVQELVASLQKKVADPQFALMLGVHHVQVTVGYATWDYEQTEELFLQIADTMLYVAKQEARDTAL